MTQTGSLNQPYAGPFTPADERQVADVLSCLADPEHSLASTAERHGTTIHALTRWMATPEIAARLDAIEHAFARMLRLQVLDNLPHVANCLVDVVRDTQDELEHIPKNPHSVRHLEQRTRCRETARKACTLLIRLPLHRRPRPGAQAPRTPRCPEVRPRPTPRPPRLRLHRRRPQDGPRPLGTGPPPPSSRG